MCITVSRRLTTFARRSLSSSPGHARPSLTSSDVDTRHGHVVRGLVHRILFGAAQMDCHHRHHQQAWLCFSVNLHWHTSFDSNESCPFLWFVCVCGARARARARARVCVSVYVRVCTYVCVCARVRVCV